MSALGAHGALLAGSTPPTYRVPVTVPAGAVTEALAGFPVYVDLALMPAGFWSGLAYRDGRDIRVRAAGGAEIPFDLVSVDPIDKVGALWIRWPALAAGSASTLYVHCGARGLAAVPPAAANGRIACWAGYQVVTMLGHNLVNRASTAYPVQTGLGFGLLEVSAGPNVGAHQGVAFDGAYYYISDTNALRKYDAAWSLVASNANPCGDVGGGVDHCGDLEVVDGIVYVPVEQYASTSSWSAPRIARFRASDLSFLGSVSIAAEGHEASTLAYCPVDDCLYVASFVDGSALRRYDRRTLAYGGALTLSSPIASIQGLTWWDGAWWVNSDAADDVRRVEADGTVRGTVWGLGGGATGAWEGLGHADNALLALHDVDAAGNGVVKRLGRRAVAGRAGSRYFGDHGLEFAATHTTSWTLGVTAILDSKAANRALLSFGLSGSTDGTKRVSLTYRQSSDRFGVWSNSDSWLLDTVSPTVGTAYRLHVANDGTSARRLYRNGALVATKSAPSGQPAAGANALFVAKSDAGLNEPLIGQLGFAYLRAGVLSAGWIAAETSNLANPGGFVSVGAVETVA